ncbi:MAG: DUF4349 domain-containing protein [Acidimicrobiales bacterium]|nr:DUF4349 domain-containing protein [Acidimicrobiales bacterium]
MSTRRSTAPIPATPPGASAPRRPAAVAVRAAVAVAVGLGLAGCGAIGSGSSDSATAGPATEEVAASSAGGSPGAVDGDAAGLADSESANAESADAGRLAPPTTAPGSGAVVPGGGEAVPALQPLDIGRSIIFNATVAVEVESVAVASDAAMTAIGGLGGFLYGQQSTNEPTPSNVLTFKVAPKDFQEALRRLGGLGVVREQQVSSDDVTDTVVDLQSRIAAAQVSVERLRAFLAEASDVNALAALERELLTRESQLEQLNGQLRGVQSQVDLATITLTLSQPASNGPALELTVTAYAGSAEGVTSCPGEEELAVDEGDPITLCYELRNSGDTVLRDLRLDDPGLAVARGDLRVIQGDLAAPLAPEGVLLLAVSKEASVAAASQPRVRAVAVGADGEPLRSEVQTTVGTPALSVAEDLSRPGFVDALRSGGRGVAALVSLLVMAVGFALPFAWVLPLAYGLRVLWRRRAARTVRNARPDAVVPAGAAGTATRSAPASPEPVLVGTGGSEGAAEGGAGAQPGEV